MHVRDVVLGMVATRGLSRRAVSVQCGRAPSWLSSSLDGRADGLTCSTVATVADVCGYTLACVPSSVPLPRGALVIDAQTAQTSTDGTVHSTD